MQCSRMVVLRLFTLPPLAVSPWPCCPQPGTAQTARPVRCRQAVLVLRGQHEAAHACVLRTPAAPHSEISSMHCSALRPPALFSLSAMSFRAPCPLRPVSLSGDPGARLGKKRPCPPLWGDFPMSALPPERFSWPHTGMVSFFVKKITNKSSHLHRIFRP